ncbi:MAG: sigma-70 family RNA polymerase sigma factor [Gammaproteobacteria bacterium]|nr:sigma-70 family RNA polymerase sigma factor [Gammaproteobacteria bacterium]
MKKYNVQNYIRYKDDVKDSISRLGSKGWDEYTRDELIVKFLPLVENLARKFSTSQQASGVMSINDLIQEGSLGLTAAVDKIIIDVIMESEDPERTIKSFLSKRIRGAIRRAIDMNRGSMRIPEHKLNEIRKDFGEDKRKVEMFFNSVFLSLDAGRDDGSTYDVPDTSAEYNKELLGAYIKSLMHQYLNHREFQVLRLSFGLDCDKHSAKEIASILGMKGDSSYVRVSQLKKQAIERLIENVPHSQVVDYL